MGKKILGVLVCMLFLVTLIPMTSATTIESPKPLIAQRHFFKTCSINATGLIENMMWKTLFSGQINNHAAAVFWLIQWDDFNTTIPTTVTISSQNGTVLWSNSEPLGIWAVKLFFYRGVYTTSRTPDDRLVVHLEGKVAFVITLND